MTLVVLPVWRQRMALSGVRQLLTISASEPLIAGDKQALKWLGAIAAKLMQEDGDARTSPRSPE
jgi:hypothetical protein